MQTTEQNLEARQSRRMASDARYLDRLEKLEAKAEPMIGELIREGRAVYYVWPIGGKYREDASHSALVDYLIRNQWVH